MPESAFDARSSAIDSHPSEAADIVRKAQAGDHAAFEYLYQCYKTSIWQRLMSLVGEQEVARDLFQETFLRAWNGLPKTRANLQFGPWLKRIAANTAIDYLRHKTTLKFLPFPEPDQEELQWSIPQVAGPEVSAGEKECIEQTLAAMVPRYRLCVLLQDQWGFSQREIAQMLSVSEKCVSSYISRGRIQMRHLYKSLSGDNEIRAKGGTR